MSAIQDTFEQALKHHGAGNLAEAELLYRQVLDADAHHLEAHSKLASVLYLQGNFKAAANAYQQVLRLKPDDPHANYNRGLALQRTGRMAEAIDHYHQALKLQPNLFLAWNNMGSAFKAVDKFDEAIVCYQNALRLNPDCGEALGNLANVFAHQNRIDDAIACHRQARALRPDSPEANFNLGLALEKAGLLEEACSAFREAVLLKPQSVDAQFTFGSVLQELGQWEDALACFNEVLRLAPQHAKAHLNRAHIWLQQGNWKEGWAEFEWRWRTENVPRLFFPKPRWNGDPLEGRTLLLVAEQGLGDTLQFIRYFPWLQKRGERVKVLCQRPLQRLLADGLGSENVAIQGSKLPDYNVYAPLLSLPGLLGTTPTSVPADVSYLKADDDLIKKWREELAPLRGFKVGIAWNGKPSVGDHRRGLSLAQFAILARVPGVHLISLQKGAGTAQLEALADPFAVLDLTSRLDEASGPFRDTAAVMKNLDLIVCADTAVAHLAGALGVPVWLALRFVPDWRWSLKDESTPWYPTMRLWRQSRAGDWDGVFERMASQLGQQAKSRVGL